DYSCYSYTLTRKGIKILNVRIIKKNIPLEDQQHSDIHTLLCTCPLDKLAYSVSLIWSGIDPIMPCLVNMRCFFTWMAPRTLIVLIDTNTLKNEDVGVQMI
ncbi:unnamed protein product, partial [Rotaria sp. Silwood2]